MGKKFWAIDLGTTKSSVAYYSASLKKGVCCPNEQGNYATPSVVCIYPDGEKVVGEEARDCAKIYTDRTAQLFKRKIDQKKAYISVDGKDYSAKDLSVVVLKRMSDYAKEETGEQIEEVVITVPAYFDAAARQAVMDAGKEAGFWKVTLLDEPVAALYNSISFHNNMNGKNVLIFDFGGGTLDIVLARVTKDCVDEVLIGGDPNLGGSDFDKAFEEYISWKFLRNAGLQIDEQQELILKTELAKIALSEKQDTRFTVATPLGRKEIKVNRSEFLEAAAELIAKTKNVVKGIKSEMTSQGITKVDKVILAGGSTNMPWVRECLKEEFKDAEVVGKDVELCVANGAAVYAKAIAENKKQKIVQSFRNNTDRIQTLNRVTGRSYGIAALNEGKACVYTLIPKNSTLPAKGKHVFYTKYWGQETANIMVNETFTSAQKEHIANGKQIGVCELKIKERNLPSKSPISVTLELDENGLLHVQAEELKGRTKVEAQIKTLEAS